MSVQLARRFVEHAEGALTTGPGALFQGDKSPMWSAYDELLAAAPDPEASGNDDDVDPVIVVKKAGRKPRARKKTAKKSNRKAGKPSPAAQRAAANRICEIWQLQLRGRLADGDAEQRQIALRKLASLRELEARIERNANIRLAMENALVAMTGYGRTVR